MGNLPEPGAASLDVFCETLRHGVCLGGGGPLVREREELSYHSSCI
jgi:hypothetical protein